MRRRHWTCHECGGTLGVIISCGPGHYGRTKRCCCRDTTMKKLSTAFYFLGYAITLQLESQVHDRVQLTDGLGSQQ